ncbi:hypothetical protein [Thermostichus vulcanus]|uniref:Uncharacterized protein n=1 Tax=Thermostichus vulcanus str. 'Rupite' TaxID=2813851 RepID=A0ABT0C8A6_THEVL|nr:hypothetical protein [Thermostichus vulcanus]MCJ2542023.1 hypothetical protein [Thermostichus vulcanus str. 'Rupite']
MDWKAWKLSRQNMAGAAMRQLFLRAAICALIAIVGVHFVAADQRWLLLVLVGICGIVISLTRAAFDKTLSRAERIVFVLWDVIIFLILIGLILF